MATKLELKPVEHQNSLGQTIKPGDNVIVVTTGYNHQVNIKPGVYLGKKNDGCSCRVTEHHTHYRFKETGESVGSRWDDHAKKRGVFPDYPKYERYPIDSPKYGPDYTEKYKEWRIGFDAHSKEQQKITNEYNGKWNEVFEQYEPFKVSYFRHTTLQLNRIYKMDTSVFDLKV
jgi:hypothetical protein